MNWAARLARGSTFAVASACWDPWSDGNSSARLVLTCRFMGSVPRSQCRTQHMPANQYRLPNHRHDSRSIAQFEKIQPQNAGRVSWRTPPSLTGATLRASPLLSSVSTARPHSVAGPLDASNFAPGSLRRKRFSGSSLFINDGIVIGSHANIRYESRSGWKDAIVGGRRMGVRSDNETYEPVGKIAHRLLLARRLTMKIDN